jgi:uncharacterized protein (TIGR04141 family)
MKKLSNKLSTAFLFHTAHLNALNENGEKIDSWTVGDCISGEIKYDNTTYIINEGIYFAIDNNYLQTLNEYVNKIKDYCPNPPLLHSLPKENEDPYIKRFTRQRRSSLKFHTATIAYKGATAIEVCDIAMKNRALIHIKRGKSSSDLSHLFSQAVVSAELLSMDEQFRKLIKQRMEKVFKKVSKNKLKEFGWIHANQFKPAKCEVVMAIMTNCQKKPLSEVLPFFSKVNVRMRCDDLRKMGYQYSVAQITIA